MPIHLRQIHELNSGDRVWVARCLKKWLSIPKTRQDLYFPVEHICNSFAHVTTETGLACLKRWSRDWWTYAITHRTETVMSKHKSYQFPPDLFPFTLRPIQQQAWDWFETVEDRNLLVVAPTGIGKTEIGEMAIRRALDQGYSALWLSPLKSDTAEKLLRFEQRGYRVLVDTGTSRVETKGHAVADPDIIVTVNERADSIMRSILKRSVVYEGEEYKGHSKREVGVLVIDEIHNFGSKGRGPTLESFIIKWRHLYPFATIVGLSATVGNPSHVARWLNADLIRAPDSARPVPLSKRIRLYEDQGWYKGNYEERIHHLETILEKHDGSQFLVFCTSKYRAQLLARYLSGLGERDQMTVGAMLNTGVAYHHGKVAHSQKRKIEEAFKDGTISIICCTTTLAQGINLPADVVVMFDTHFYSFLTARATMVDHNTITQIAGRAGRPGLSDHGYFYCIALESDLGPVVARMDRDMTCYSWIWSRLPDTILEWYVSEICRCKEDLLDMAREVYSYQIEPSDPEYIGKAQIADQLEWLVANDLLEPSLTQATDRGRATALYMVRPQTAVHWHTMANFVTNMNKPEHIFALLMHTEEFMRNMVVNYDKDQFLLEQGRQWLQLVTCNCGAVFPYVDRPTCPNCHETDPYKFRVFMFDDRMNKAFAMVFREEIEKDVTPANRQIKVSPTDEGILKGEVNRMLSACCAILSDHEHIDIIKEAALYANAGRLDPSTIELLQVEGVGMTFATRLVNAGIAKVHDLISTSPNYLSKILQITNFQAEKLKAAAKKYWAET